ncbi:pentapeptide repeat-containing protein [Haloparvum sedimenti]|uniref:pentapeptide repeat-containing protein n=1 Tax=Haloparvum sedimenti TaxID=1678448 RepID=UPI00071E8B57|nr:pentapeptide repeat-containing protein [Haloparvum sedimenti]
MLFHEVTTFADARFRDGASFRAAQFEATANMHEEDADFGGAVFEAGADFGRVTFAYANFRGTTFGEAATFVGVTVHESAAFRPEAGEHGETLVDLRDAAVGGGTMGQPEAGSAFYDLTDAVVGSVTLDHSDSAHPLFDHFRFCNTDFEGFDFSAHKAHLAENGWSIHEFAAGDAVIPEGSVAAIDNPATLENTYLKAKNCASDYGDRKAAAEFFIREMIYRRKKNWKIAAGYDVAENANLATHDAIDAVDAFVPWDGDAEDASDVGPLGRIRALGKWAGNNVLYQTCGYGERLWRIVYISSVAIVFWALLYTIVPTGGEGSTLRTVTSASEFATPDGLLAVGQNMYFSTATFITLEYVGAPGSSLARWLASLEAYFGALLIALVVFVLGRRVAW